MCMKFKKQQWHSEDICERILLVPGELRNATFPGTFLQMLTQIYPIDLMQFHVTLTRDVLCFGCFLHFLQDCAVRVQGLSKEIRENKDLINTEGGFHSKILYLISE